MAIHQIPPMHKKWENDYYAVTSMEYNDETGQAFIDQQLTNTFKFAPFQAGASALFYDEKKQLGRSDLALECPAGGIFGGAGHASHQFQVQAPAGTQGFALAQFYHPEGIAAIAESVGAFFSDIAQAIANAAVAAKQWCDHNPQACGAIACAAFVLAGTALCLATSPECEVVITIIAPTSIG